MTYRCGLGPGIPGGPRNPSLVCDCCENRLVLTFHGGMAPKWLEDGKAPSGWAYAKINDRQNFHVCPSCTTYAIESVGVRSAGAQPLVVDDDDDTTG